MDFAEALHAECRKKGWSLTMRECEKLAAEGVFTRSIFHAPASWRPGGMVAVTRKMAERARRAAKEEK